MMVFSFQLEVSYGAGGKWGLVFTHDGCGGNSRIRDVRVLQLLNFCGKPP